MLFATLFAALAGTPAAPPAPASEARIEVRRVEVSYTFSGRDLFLYGKAPAGTRYVAVVMEGPPAGPVRLMEKGRVAFFWLGVRQYRLTGAPGLFLVNVSCPICNGFAPCRHTGALEAVNRLLAPLGLLTGPEEVAARARLESLSSPLRPGEEERVLSGFWTLQTQRGLYGVRTNGVRLNAAGDFYHSFHLPASAPDGLYGVTTYLLGEDRLLGVETNELFLRKTGMVDWLSGLADRRPLLYGAFTVLIAVASGWIAGTLFGRGGH
ncbi:MAG: TIGR02186 family protein [Acidithiobacillales bacterium]